jgi:hypothetical protein
MLHLEDIAAASSPQPRQATRSKALIWGCCMTSANRA